MADLRYDQFGLPTAPIGSGGVNSGMGRAHTINDILLIADPSTGKNAKITQAMLLLNATNLTVGSIPTARFAADSIPVSSLQFPGGLTFLRADGNWTLPIGFADPMTTIGDMIYRDGGNNTDRLPPGVDGQVLTMAGGLPSWENPAGGGGGGITALTGDVTASGSGSVAATISANAVTDAKLRQSAGLSVIGRSTNSSGNVADITAGVDGHVLRRSGTTLGFGLLVTANYTDESVTFAKVQNIAENVLLGRAASAGTGDIQVITIGANLTLSSGGELSATGGGGGGWSLTGNAGTVDGTNFLGTTDDVPLTFRINNNRAGRIENTGQNTSLGYLAGIISGEGDQNTAIGCQALASMVECASNTAVGAFALTALDSAEGNCAFGRTTLSTLTTGNYNTGFGYNTGLGLTTGSGNTILGGNVTGLPSGLSNNIILANGVGVTYMQFDSSAFITAAVQGASTDYVNFLPWGQDATGLIKRMEAWPEGGGGVTTMQPFGSAPNANGATISGVNLTLQPADATNPGGLTTGAQTIAGAKTWTGNATFQGTGAGIISVSGTSGIVAAGSSFGGEFTSSAGTPVLISNSGTGAGVVGAMIIQRNGSYTGAANDGLEVRFAGKSSGNNNRNFAMINAIFSTATDTAETGALTFHMMLAGVSLAEKFRMHGSGMFEAVASIKTGAPSGSTAQPWKLGALTTGSSGITQDATKYVTIDINGTLVNLAVAVLP